MGSNRDAFCAAVQRLDVDDGLQQLNQLNALACLAKLCQLEQEAKGRPDWRPKGTSLALTWCHEAERQNALHHVRGPLGMDALARALGVCHLAACDWMSSAFLLH